MTDKIDINNLGKKSTKDLIVINIVKTNELVTQVNSINGGFRDHEKRICILEKNELEENAVEKDRAAKMKEESRNQIFVSMSSGQQKTLIAFIAIGLIGILIQAVEAIANFL